MAWAENGTENWTTTRTGAASLIQANSRIVIQVTSNTTNSRIARVYDFYYSGTNYTMDSGQNKSWSAWTTPSEVATAELAAYDTSTVQPHFDSTNVHGFDLNTFLTTADTTSLLPTDATDGQIAIYDATANNWFASDIPVSMPADATDGQIAVYDGTTGEWVA